MRFFYLLYNFTEVQVSRVIIVLLLQNCFAWCKDHTHQAIYIYIYIYMYVYIVCLFVCLFFFYKKVVTNVVRMAKNNNNNERKTFSAKLTFSCLKFIFQVQGCPLVMTCRDPSSSSLFKCVFYLLRSSDKI